MNKTARLLATTVIAGGFFLWTPPDDTVSFPNEIRKLARVKSVVVGPHSAAFATEGGIHDIYANDKGFEGYDAGKFSRQFSDCL